MTAARIGRVTLKGGAELRILRRPEHKNPDTGVMENYNAKLVEHARSIASDPDEIVGYFIMAVFRDGAHNSASRLLPSASIPQSLWPSYVAEVARRYMISRHDIHEALK
jgi:hypothetical protein